MRKLALLGLIFLGLGGLCGFLSRLLPPFTLSSAVPSSAPSVTPAQALREDEIQYKAYTRSQTVIHTLTIPTQGQYLITPAIAPDLSTIEAFSRQKKAIAVLNGGFFDPKNQQSTSYVMVQGKIVADPKLNQRLMDNPKLTPYLSQILNRSELRRYQCGTASGLAMRYEIAQHQAPTPPTCQLIDSLGGGPRLLPALTLEQEGFIASDNGRMIRDSLGSSQPNARSAIGLTRDGKLILVMVAQTSGAPSNSGLSLPELAEFLKTLGAETAMNLDGGSSSSLYYNGKIIEGKVNQSGEPVVRALKSFLIVQKLPKTSP